LTTEEKERDDVIEGRHKLSQSSPFWGFIIVIISRVASLHILFFRVISAACVCAKASIVDAGDLSSSPSSHLAGTEELTERRSTCWQDKDTQSYYYYYSVYLLLLLGYGIHRFFVTRIGIFVFQKGKEKKK
jgi:hypothetical protein